MAVQSYDPGEAYDEEDRVLLELISTHVAGAMEYKAAEEALRASEAKFRAIFDHAGIGIALLDLKGRILDMNATGQSIIGYELDELTDLDFTDYNHPEDAARSRELFAQLLCGEREHFEIVKRYIHKLGHVSWGRQVVTLVRGVRGEAGFAISMLEDITEHKKADDALRHMAYHDALTGLPNRILFQERLERAISRERRGKGRVFAVLFLDLDRFKIINDSLGHAFGDKLLVAITRRVSECIREVDTLARFGGDEFAILLDGMDDTRFVSRVIGRIQEQFSRPFFIEEHEVFAAASIGVVAKTWLYEDAEDILRDADTAMYRAKEAGTGSFAIFDHAMHEQARGRLRWETSLRRALDQGRIIPFYQPIVDLDTGETTALEALARWPHSERGMIPPAEFIPVAEETGLIHAIDMGILATACRTLVDITGRRARAANLALHVNISARTFQLQENLPREVARILDKTGLAPSRLKLEITENLLLWGVPRVEGMIAELTRLGVGLVMDDFGTGYSSLSALRNFPFTSLKIEGSFIRSMEESPEDAGILETILKLGRTLGMDVVAEGVETASQAAALQRLDCGYMQGFLAARPMDAAALEELLAGEAPLRLLHNAAHPESRT
jgi:diguanylate cyclase (GGDEF)-like protein/PAS domain S-box-containing protein